LGEALEEMLREVLEMLGEMLEGKLEKLDELDERLEEKVEGKVEGKMEEKVGEKVEERLGEQLEGSLDTRVGDPSIAGSGWLKIDQFGRNVRIDLEVDSRTHQVNASALSRLNGDKPPGRGAGNSPGAKPS
jgi:vacuolar-type H+-ATPase subunit E/Vma4